MKLDLKTAVRMITAAEEEAASLDLPVVVAVVDDGGNLLAQHRMDGAPIASIDISLNKAFSAVALKQATHEIAPMCQPGRPVFGIHNMCNGRLVIFGGGYPVKTDNEIIGGIGVSGGSEEQDARCAQAGLRIISD